MCSIYYSSGEFSYLPAAFPDSWQALVLTVHRQALIEMSGILCICSAVDYFSFHGFHCEKPFSQPLTGDAFIHAGFRNASCPSSQENQMLALFFLHCLAPELAGDSVLETKPKLFLSFL